MSFLDPLEGTEISEKRASIMDLTTQLEAAIHLIDRWLAYRCYADRLPGLALGIVHKDRILFTKGYGYANLAEQLPTTPTTCYRIASFSKIFTTITILQLAEQGKLHLDDPIVQYLPWCRSEQAKETAHITIRQVLTHTSGLDRDGTTPHWINFSFPSLDQIQQHIAEGAMIYLPAEKWKYSNLGFTLLGHLISAITGTPYEDYVTEHIIKRLGLGHTAPTLTEHVTEHLALGYSRNLPDHPREPLPAIDTEAMHAATGFISNVTDLCQFMLAQFDTDTRLLSDTTKREMRRIQWLSPSGEGNGWALGYSTSTVNQRHLYGHGGGFPGYISRFDIDPERQIGIVILANAIDAPSHDLVNQAMRIIDYIMTHASELEQPDHSIEHITSYEGTFRNIWGDIIITAIGNSLLLLDADTPFPISTFCQLRYDHHDQFTMITGDPGGHIGEPVRFERDEQDIVHKVYVGPNPLTRVKS